MDIYGEIFTNEYFQKLKSSDNAETKSLLGFHRKDNPYLIEFKKYLRFVKKQGALTKKRKGDLLAADWAHFVQTKNELLIAYFVKYFLRYDVMFDPPSFQGKKGDLQIVLKNGKKVFIEITSPYRRFPANGFMAGDYSGTIKRSLSRKYITLPKDNRITLIILGHGLGDTRPYEKTMIKAVYGETVTKIPWKIEGEQLDSDKAYNAFNPNGFFQQNTGNLSAVGIIDMACYSDGQKEYCCEIYHNPFAVNILPREMFKKNDTTVQHPTIDSTLHRFYSK
jgi:hypothetical protein